MLRRRSGSRKELSNKQILNKFFDFLDSSIWALPVATFIEQKSTIFDRAYGEQAHDEYNKCFREFNDLVSTLLDCFCGDAEIEASRFKEAISTISQHRLDRHQRTNLEPVAASNDFEVFVPMMMRKNLELQLQALQMIEYLCGVIPQVLLLQDGETLRDRESLSAEDTERYVLISVMRQSKEEFDGENAVLRKELQFMTQQGDDEKRRLNEQATKEAALVQQAMNDKPLNIKSTLELQASGKPPMPSELLREPVKPTATNDKEKQELPRPPPSRRASSSHRVPTGDAAKKNDTNNTEKNAEKPPIEPRASSSRRKSSIGRASQVFDKTRTPLNDVRRPSLPSKPPTPSGTRAEPRPESPGAEHGPRRKNINDVNALLKERDRLNTADVEARRQYLKQQRDKLLEMKQNERERQLQEVSTRVAQERPRTAKAARGAMRGAGQTDLETRKIIAEKLKTEIIH